MKKILILGGTRYLGRAVVNKIKNHTKFDVATLSRSQEKTDIKHFICDRKKTSDLKKKIINFKPNIILDMINFNGEDSNQMLTLYEKKNFSELTHYITISSFFVYNHFDYKIFSEKKINNKFDNKYIDEYTKCKIDSELELYSSKLMDITTILRLPFIFSADDYTNRFQRLCQISSESNKVTLDSGFKYSLVRKDDAAEAIIKIFNSNPAGIIDLSNSGYATHKKLLEVISKSRPKSKNNKYYQEKNFPYLVKKDICLNSQKIIIDLPIIKAIKNEAKKYWLSNPQLIEKNIL
jgi:nucleoside-diphosphate-sugar epimerase